jgi:hypothetical protein
MGAIEAQCDPVNAAGLNRTLWATCDDELLAIPAPAANTHKVTAPITYRVANGTAVPPVTAGKFYAWKFSSEDQEYSCEQDEASGLWKTEVKIFIEKIKAEKTQVLKGMGGENKIIVFQDKNGAKRIVGDLENGAKMKVREQSNPKNGYVVTIMWTSAEPPLHYESTITV